MHSNNYRDAGRYLCEFVYFKSLYTMNRRALFIHVPTLDVFPAEQCAQAIKLIIEYITRSLSWLLTTNLLILIFHSLHHMQCETIPVIFVLVNKTAIESNRLFIRITTYIWDNGYLQALIFYIRQHGAYNLILYCTTTFRNVLNIFS